MSKGTTYKLQIGPTHPAFKEPVRFEFEVDGEQVIKADIDMGYTHRGIEHIMLSRSFIQIIYLVERICGICSFSHPMAYCLAIENAAEIEVPPRAKYIRTIIGELERLHSHLLWAGVAAREIGFDTFFHYTWKIREKAMDCLELITGNRVNYAMLTIGGVRRDITEENLPALLKTVEYYSELYGRASEILLDDMSLRLRCEGVGILTYDEAVDLCAVGPTARASGLAKDVRSDYPMSAYPDIEWFKPVTPADMGRVPVGDVYDRFTVRVLEMKQSVDIINFCIENMPEGDISVESNANKMINSLKKLTCEGIGRYEAPRGEVSHYDILDKRDGPVCSKIKAPTYANAASWIPMFKGTEIADIPIVMASIDPCVACADRMSIVNKGKRSMVDYSELRRMSIEKMKRIQGNKGVQR